MSSVLSPDRVPEADYAWHLASKLADHGHAVDLITTKGVPVLVPPGVRLRADLRHWSWQGLPGLMLSLARSRPDVVVLSYIGWMYGNHPMITTIPRLIARLHRGIRVVTVVHNVDHNDVSLMALTRTRRILALLGMSNMERRFGTLINDSQLVIVGSHAQRDVLVASSPTTDCRVVVRPVPPLNVIRDDRQVAREEGRSLLGLGPDDQAIGFFGYRYPGKGVETLVEAFALLASEMPDTKLIFIGGILDLPAEGGVTARTHERIHELGLDSRVVWSGDFRSGSTEASTLLHALDVVALPFDIGAQLSNSSASTVLVHRLPLITTVGGATDAALRELGACLLVPPRDPPALASAIGDVLTDRLRREALRRGADRLVATWISWPTYLDTVESAAGDGPTMSPQSGQSP